VKPTIKDTWTPIGHSVVCPKHGPLVEIKRHCHNLERYFLSANNYYSGSLSSWFGIASGITEVKYISDLYDDYVQWCGTAIEYENAKSDFHSKLIRELTRFNFIWGGFEAYYDSLELGECPNPRKRGIVNTVNYHLKVKYENNFPPLPYYNETVEHLKKLISKNEWYGKTNDLFSGDYCSSESLIGLKVVYKIRNSFAHGAFRFSEPEGWHYETPYDIGIINTSSRILLMTMQMIILSVVKELKLKVPQIHKSEDDGVRAGTFLTKLHLKSFRHS
jgi:hypothetical protein